MEKNKNTFVKGAAILGVAGLIVKIIGAVYRIPLTNILQSGSLDGMLFYATAYPYYSWLLVISSAGFPTAISKLVSERVAVGDRQGATDVFRTALRLLIIIGVVTSAILFLLASPLAKLANVPNAKYSLMALAPSLIIVSIMCAYRGYLQGMQRMTGTAVSQITEQVGKLIMGYALAIVFKKLYPTEPWFWAMGTLIGITLSELLALIVIYWVYLRNRRTLPSYGLEHSSYDRATFRTVGLSLLAIAIPITIGASIMPITGIADSIFINRLLENRYVALGIEGEVAKTMANDGFVALRSYVTPLINMPAVLTLALSMSLVPAIAPMVAARDRRGVRKAASTGMKLAMLVGAPCAAGLFVLGAPIMAMLYHKVRESTDVYYVSGFMKQILNIGPQSQASVYAIAGGIMQVAAIGVLFLSLVQTMTGIIQGMGKQRVPVYFLIAGGVVKVLAMLLLMRFTRLGVLGAALSTVLCYAVAGIGDTWYTVRRANISVDLFDLFGKPILSSLVMGVCVFFSYKAIYAMGHPTIATLGSIVVGVIVYAACLWLLRAFNKNDLEFIPGGRRLAKLFRVEY